MSKEEDQTGVVPMDETTNQQDFSPELLRVYYSRLFPYTQMFRWLSYGNDPDGTQSWMDKDFFNRREFSFTIEDDIYLRYQSFRSVTEMEAEIKKRQPYKIDIGAVFSVSPSQHSTVKAGAFSPQQRELVFDIDMNDYDDIRTCCTGATICNKCWAFMTMAIKVLNRALRDDFGFKHLLFIYSGRRGVHCWVGDENARNLANEARNAVVNYLTVVGGNDNSGSRTNLSWPIHPSLMHAYEILSSMFEEHIISEEGQNILGTEEGWSKFLATVPNADIRERFAREWAGKGHLTTELEKWDDLNQAVEAAIKKEKESRRTKRANSYKNDPLTALQLWKYEVVFFYCYPRLDENVSKGMNHLLKSPFCIHPKTGRVCVPINAETCEDFNPFSVPSLGTLCSQLDSYQPTEEKEEEEIADYQKTGMAQYIKFFEEDFLAPLYKSVKLKARREAEGSLAMRNDW